MSQHTQGPWFFGTAGVQNDWPEVRAQGTGELVARTYAGKAYADARLIAALPDLLAVCERVAMYFDGTDAPLGSAVRAAIAKAKGV